MNINKCDCGFIFNKAGEKLNYEEKTDSGGCIWVICPDCGFKGKK